MARERDLVVAVCDQISIDLGSKNGFVIDPVRWESHTVSARSERSQLAITEQLGDYDIYLGIMGYYFGSSTGAFASGTEEEFEDALAMNLQNGRPHIQFYFSSARVDPAEIQMDQYALVQGFQEKLRREGVYYRKFEDLTGFEVMVRSGVTDSVFRLMEDSSFLSRKGHEGEAASYKALRPYEVLRNLRNEFSKDPTVASTLLIFEATRSINSFSDRLLMVAKRTNRISRAINEVVREAHKLNSSAKRSPSNLKKSFEALMVLMEDFTNWLSYEIPLMEKDFKSGMSDFQRGAIIIKTSQDHSEDDLRALFRVVENTKGDLEKLANAVIASGKSIPEIGDSERWEVNRKIYRAITLDFDYFLKLSISTITETKNSVLQ